MTLHETSVMPTSRAAETPYWRCRPALWIVIAIVLAYAFVLTLPHFFSLHGPFARTFNSMLDHLLQGQFDVDPAIVGMEGFARDGRVYAYWGIMPAILRLPVMVLPGWRDLDFTIPFCTVALLAMGATKVWTVRYVLRRRQDLRRSVRLAICLAVALSGAQTSFLRFSLYQEVCLWAGLFAAIFVAAAIVAQHRGLGKRERLIMAVAAGAALLTRVSTGIGLIVAFGLLLSVEAVRNRKEWRAQFDRSIPALLALVAAGLMTAWINYARWGDPLTFADYKYYLFNIKYPDRLMRTAAYGLFNLQRIPFGIIYYIFPVWVFRGQDGHLLFDSTRFRLIDSAELPPSTFLLTDPLLLLLGGIALVAWMTRRHSGGVQGGAITAGLAIPAFLMMTAISMCFRYRMDFYPLIEFLAFSGLAMVDRDSVIVRSWVIWTLAVVSIVCSISIGVLYVAGKLGPGQLLIGQGIGHFYLGRLGLI